MARRESAQELVDSAPSLGAAFAGLSRCHGESPALAGEGGELSYAELSARADALAAALAARGALPGERVGLCLDRSVEAAVAVLGILRAGATYVPLDPAYPLDRLRFIAADASLTRVVGDAAAAARLGLDGVEAVGTAQPAAPAPAVEVARDSPAYVIYTSGSTGRPKGVVVTHGNVLELLRGTHEVFDFTAADRWSVFHSFNFDFAVWELWRPFVEGGCAVIVPEAVVRSPAAFAAFVAAQRISVLNQVPSVFRYLVLAWEHEGRPALALRHVIFGGEAVDLATVARFAAALGPARPRFTNMYGITEITVHATFKRLTEEDWGSPGASPIGRALPHLEITVLDEAGNPVAPGEVGEMWIAGGGVAAGYLGRPDLTAERFPTIAIAGVERRCYRSGDLARLLEGGELEFAGRNDEQVKINGFRIEPGEIEAVLRECPAVSAAAVVATAARAGAVLTAAVTLEADATPEELRRHCQARLPAHMVPARIRVLGELPLTLSGKVDRRALAAVVGEV